jgi:hypothetical protein
MGSAACSQGTKSARSASVASGILRLSPIDRFACRISRVDDAPNFTPLGVSKCPNKAGSCAGHKPGLLGDFSRSLAEHHNHTGAIPHWLVGSGSSDSNNDTASSIRADGTDQRRGGSEHLGNSLSMRRTTAASTVSPGVEGKSNHDSMGDASVRVSKNRSQDARASLDETRPREWAPPLEIGSPSYATADSITGTVWLQCGRMPDGEGQQDLEIAIASALRDTFAAGSAGQRRASPRRYPGLRPAGTPPGRTVATSALWVVAPRHRFRPTNSTDSQTLQKGRSRCLHVAAAKWPRTCKEMWCRTIRGLLARRGAVLTPHVGGQSIPLGGVVARVSHPCARSRASPGRHAIGPIPGFPGD